MSTLIWASAVCRAGDVPPSVRSLVPPEWAAAPGARWEQHPGGLWSIPVFMHG